MKQNLATIAIILAVLCSCNRSAPMSERVVRSEMARCEDAFHLDFQDGKANWNYTPGLEMKAFLDVCQTYGGDDILEYVDHWYDSMIDEDGTVSHYSGDSYSVDKVCPANTLFQLFDMTGKTKYRAAMDYMYERLREHPRTSQGALWHKSIYPYQIWLDGLFMAQPFHACYASRYLEGKAREEAFEEIVNDFLITAEHTFDMETGLYRHAWDETCSMFWCDPQTGQSAHCWGRGLGWYCMAIVDVLDYLPEDTPGRDRMIDILRGLVETLPSFADAQSGMWYQVLDQNGREGNYLEATCSAMISYTLLKGVRKGWLDEALLPYAKKTYQNLLKTFVTEDEEGLVSINQCCSVGGLGGKQMRKGDFDYYLSEPIRSNDAKGIGPLIWASLEMEKL